MEMLKFGLFGVEVTSTDDPDSIYAEPSFLEMFNTYEEAYKEGTILEEKGKIYWFEIYPLD